MQGTSAFSGRQRNPARKAFGKCVVCGDRVENKHDYITAEEGYCHRTCIM